MSVFTTADVNSRYGSSALYGLRDMTNIDNSTFYAKALEAGVAAAGTGTGYTTFESVAQAHGYTFGLSGQDDSLFVEAEVFPYATASGDVVWSGQTYNLGSTLDVPAGVKWFTQGSRFYRTFGSIGPGGGLYVGDGPTVGNRLVQSVGFPSLNQPGIEITGNGVFGPDLPFSRLTAATTCTFYIDAPNTYDGTGAMTAPGLGRIAFAGASAFLIGELVLMYSKRGDKNQNTAYRVLANSGSVLSVTPAPDQAAVVTGMTAQVVPPGGHVFGINSDGGRLDDVQLINSRGIQFLTYGDDFTSFGKKSTATALDGGGGHRVASGRGFRSLFDQLDTSDDNPQFNPASGSTVTDSEFSHYTSHTTQGSSAAFILGGKKIQSGSGYPGTLTNCWFRFPVGTTGKENDHRGFSIKFNCGDGQNPIRNCGVQGASINMSQDNDDTISAIRLVEGRRGMVGCAVLGVNIVNAVGTPFLFYNADPVGGVSAPGETDFYVRDFVMDATSRTTTIPASDEDDQLYTSIPPIFRIYGSARRFVIENVTGFVDNGGAGIEIATKPGQYVAELVLKNWNVKGLQTGKTMLVIGNVGRVIIDGGSFDKAPGATGTVGLSMQGVVGSDLGVQKYAIINAPNWNSIDTPLAAIPGTAVDVTSGSPPGSFNSINITGVSTAPTAAAGTNTSQIANAAFVHTEVANASAALGVANRVAIGDANATIGPTVTVAAATVALTAPRTWTLPAASSVVAGYTLRVIDEVGAVGLTNTLTLLCAGSDTISGATSLVLNTAYAFTSLESNGSNKWTAGAVPGTSGHRVPLLDQSNTFSASQTVQVTGAGATLAASGEGVTIVRAKRYSGNSSGPSVSLNKFRGTIATPSAVTQNDELGVIAFTGYGGTTSPNGAFLTVTAIAATPSDTNMESRAILTMCAAGTATATELARWDHATGFSLYGVKVVGSRKTGWTASTGTATRTAFDTATATTADVAQRLKALLDDLISHGLIGT